MQVTVTFEVSDEAAKLLAECSVERVINTSVGILVEVGTSEDLCVNLHDWAHCKPVATNIWNGVRDALFRAKNGNMPQVRDWTV